ncbi:MAG: hypothetical protein BVN33_14820 [Proteobacteria bacterium ST_bin13]|nr:MAG: hypothetical protein BVN33_14820 [Proteobacteria bacterium ST_bin13]
MLPFLSIIALIYEPVGPITDPPFVYGIDQLEVIEFEDLGPSIEELEKQMQRQRQRIMELNQEGVCDE